jgi:hypothetical protein
VICGRRIASVLVVVLAVLAVGCGGGDDRSELAEQVAVLCDEARLDIEALGLPSEAGIAVILPWANRGTKLAKDIRALDGGSDSEQETIDVLATALDEYYAGLRLGHTIYAQTRSSEAYAQTIERAKAFQADADAAATELGATECTRRPFDEA